MAKILCVLYDDPVDGYPTSYLNEIMQITNERKSIMMAPVQLQFQ